MRKLFFLLLVLGACAEDEIRPEKIEYTFFVYAEPWGKFSARVDWGVNDLQDHERFTAWGFASSVEILPGDALVLKSDRLLMVKVTSNKTSEVVTVRTLRPGEIESIKL